ncbi:N-acetylmuramoyl-L-alanine amidase [Acidiphilium sp. MT5]
MTASSAIMPHLDADLGHSLSPNFDHRPANAPLDHLVLHYTGMDSAQAARARLCDPAAKVSAHYLIDEDGTIEQLVPERYRAWHAGLSYWRGVSHLNDRSIGIEIVNPGHEHGYRPFPARQITALIGLCQAILARHPIPARNIVAHSDIAPTRKTDPGELFPWPTLAAHGIGLYPSTQPDAPDLIPDLEPDLNPILTAIGYDPAAPLDARITAFQRRFAPTTITSQPDPFTRARAQQLGALFNDLGNQR